MSTASATRSFLRSAAAKATAGSARATVSIPKPKPGSSTFRFSAQKPILQRFLRSPVELSSCMESMPPFHSATASALLTSMLSVSSRPCGWTLADLNDDA